MYGPRANVNPDTWVEGCHSIPPGAAGVRVNRLATTVSKPAARIAVAARPTSPARTGRRPDSPKAGLGIVHLRGAPARIRSASTTCWSLSEGSGLGAARKRSARHFSISVSFIALPHEVRALRRVPAGPSLRPSRDAVLT